MIVSPFGEVLAGPLEGGEGLVTAEIDVNEVTRGKFDLDVAGHYARPDVFRLAVDVAAKPAVSMGDRERSVVRAAPLAQGITTEV